MARLRGKGAGSVDVFLGEVDVHLMPGGEKPVIRVAVDPKSVEVGLRKVAEQKAANEAKRAEFLRNQQLNGKSVPSPGDRGRSRSRSRSRSRGRGR